MDYIRINPADNVAVALADLKAGTLVEGVTLKTDVHIVSGLICSGDQFITNRDELDVIKGKYPQGLAVDMESGAIAQVCHLWSIPFLSFRIISDTPGVKAHFKQYLNFWDTMADKSFAVTKEFLSKI